MIFAFYQRLKMSQFTRIIKFSRGPKSPATEPSKPSSSTNTVTVPSSSGKVATQENEEQIYGDNQIAIYTAVGHSSFAPRIRKRVIEQTPNVPCAVLLH
jgi:hypothetical protein